MDKIKNLYQNLIREEIESPEVQNAKEAFLRTHFKTAPAAAGPWKKTVFAPSFRLALVGCVALAVLVKIGAFETTPELPVTPTQQPSLEISKEINVSEQVQAPLAAIQPAVPEKTAGTGATNFNNLKIKKLTSEMGATMAYQKHFPDVQITVIWVLPEVQKYGA